MGVTGASPCGGKPGHSGRRGRGLGFVPKSEYEGSQTCNYRSLITGSRAAFRNHLSPHPRQASPGVPRCSQPATKHRGDTEGGGWVQGLKRLDDKAPGSKISESPGDATYSTGTVVNNTVLYT